MPVLPDDPAQAADYGPRISGEEYDRRIVALHGDPRGADERALRRAELDITIDHRLGLRFPPERREALWHAQQRIAAHPLLTSLRFLAGRVLRGQGLSLSDAQAAYLVTQYASVLNEDELAHFFDLPREDIRRVLATRPTGAR